MEAGRLRHRVTIDEKVETPDGQGGIETTYLAWEENIPAAIEPGSGKEFMNSNQILAQVSTRITVRWRPGVVPTMRVRHESAIYNIVAVLPDKETGRTWLTLGCVSGTNDG